MASELVTVAWFDIPANAHIARNALEAAGIRAVIQDEQLVAMDYLLNLAVGGIKVQVWEEDAGRAVAVLEDLRPANERSREGGGAPEPGGESAHDESEPGEPPEDGGGEPTPHPADNARDRYARRALRAGLASLLVAPVAFYTAYLLLMTAFSDGTLTRARLRGVLVAVLVSPVLMLLSPLWVSTVLRAILGDQTG